MSQRPSRQKSRNACPYFDSYYDDYRGVILYVRVFDGHIAKNANIKMLATGAGGIALEVGALTPGMTPGKELQSGEIGLHRDKPQDHVMLKLAIR